MTEEQIKQKAEECFEHYKKSSKWKGKIFMQDEKTCFIDGYKECQKEHEGKCKTSYIKGIRTMANALKDYDRTDGVWTDYFEHTVEEVLKRLLKEIE